MLKYYPTCRYCDGYTFCSGKYAPNTLAFNNIYKSSRKVWTTHYIPSNLTALSCNYNIHKEIAIASPRVRANFVFLVCLIEFFFIALQRKHVERFGLIVTTEKVRNRHWRICLPRILSTNPYCLNQHVVVVIVVCY